jgi:catechol 2,3-dioxygenase-like lactoylglutathione lyase family enzyme
MRATRINHVSVHADDLEASARFYEELFGMERTPAPNFPGIVVVWLKLGDQQLHLFHPPVDAPAAHHFGLDVEDFETVYRKAKERGVLDVDSFRQPIRRHPLGWVQMYIRDPSGNLVEVNWRDVGSLPADIQAEVGRLEDEVTQTGDALAATLYT